MDGLTELTKVYFAHTAVQSLAPLRRATRLVAVDAGRTRVRDLSPLAASAATLQTLILTNTPTDDVATLSKLRALKTVNLRGTVVPTSADAELARGNPQLRIRRDTSAFMMQWPAGIWDFSTIGRERKLCDAP